MKKYLIIGLLIVPVSIFAASTIKKANLDTISQQLDVLIQEVRLSRTLDKVNVEKVQRTFGGVGINVPTFSVAATSSATIVGPENSVRVIATSSKRTYLYIGLMNRNTTLDATSSIDVFCKADNDKLSSLYQGIRLIASTSPSYEFTSDKGNLYTGAIRCSSQASTTLGVTEYQTTP